MKHVQCVLNAMLDYMLKASTGTKRTSHCDNKMLLETAGMCLGRMIYFCLVCTTINVLGI